MTAEEADAADEALTEIFSQTLSLIDPETLEALACSKLGGLDGGCETTGEAFLAAIKEMLCGKPDGA